LRLCGSIFSSEFAKEMPMPDIAIEGRTIHYRETGQAHNDTLLLLHAFPVNSAMWSAQLSGLAAHWRIIAPDFRGFGASDKTGPFTLEQLADDTHALIAQLKPRGRLVLAGLSMGGYVAFPYARKYADTLSALILLDTKAEPDTPDGKANRDRMIAIARERGSKPIADAMLGKLLSPDAVASRPQLVKDVRKMMEATAPDTIAHALAAMRDRPDQTSLLPTFNLPTLILVGAHDEVTPPAAAQKMHAQIPRSYLKEIPAAGHLTAMEQPAQTSAAIAQFLASLPGRK
jgi:pimeloyl-ACP methyl ester carboxylesterase